MLAAMINHLCFSTPHKQFRFYILCAICLLTNSLAAQNTYTNASFPVAGDTLFTAFDNMPDRNLIKITPPAPNQTWDYTSLQSPPELGTAVRNAAEGSAAAAFPSARFVLKLEDAEIYVKSTPNLQEIVGISGPSPLNQDERINIPYSNPAVFRKAPIAYGDTYTDLQVFRISAAAKDIPFLDSLQLPITPDSIRLGTKTDLVAKADAWGKLILSSGTFQVLRVKETSYVQRTVEAKVPFLGWLDISGILTDSLGALPLKDTTISYVFWSNLVKEPVARLIVVDDTLRSVEYKTRKDVSTSTFIPNTKNDVRTFVAYPNPMIDRVRFDIKGYQSGDYYIRIYDIVGRKVFEEKVKVTNNTTTNITTFRYQIPNLRKGTYLYNLSDKKGKSIVTKRLLVMGA